MPQFFLSRGMLIAVVCVCGFEDTLAVDFRIENRVYTGGKTEPQSGSLTLFHEGMVYDFLPAPAEVTVFDKATGRFFLLNMANREQTELSVAEVDAFMEKLKQAALRQKDALSNFFANPKFEERFDATDGELSLLSPWVTYRVASQAARTPAMANQYREFSDSYARLNAMLNPGSRPPLARLQVNEALARRGALAHAVTLTLTSVRDDVLQKTVLRSEHDFSEGLSAADVEQIQKAREARGKFKMVSYSVYQKNRK